MNERNDVPNDRPDDVPDGEPTFCPDPVAGFESPPDLPRPVEERTLELSTWTTRFEASFRHGPWSMAEVLRRPGQELALLANVRAADEAGALAWQEAAFLDVESGRNPRGGPCLFLAGIGRFEEGAFVVRQLLARTPAGEVQVLAAVARELAAARQLVTFAGKSFDAPLLKERCSAEGIALVLPRTHFDLYRMAGRLLKRRFADSRLRTLEQELLRYERVDDLPGTAAAQAWLELFEEGSTRLLLAVVRHNLLDVVALPALAAELAFRMESPQDLFERESAASVRIDQPGRLGKDRASLERALEEDPECFKALLELSKLVEREDGDLEAALAFAQRALESAQAHQADAARRRIAQLERRARQAE